MWKISFPPLVVVSILSVMLYESNLSVVKVGDCFNEVLERGGLSDLIHTTKVSPSLTYSSASVSPVLSALAPLAVSVKILLQPILSKASLCKCKVCSEVETRA